MSLILPANSLTGGYEIDNSLRFNSASSDYLSRTYGTPTNNLKYTKSFWIKRSGLTDIAKGFIFNNSTNSNTDYFYFNASDQIVVGNTITPATTAVFRDVSAWYHCVMVFDSANATADDRLILYVNGIRQTLNGTISQNSTGGNQSGVTYEIGHQGTQSRYLDGYLAEIYMIDGQALSPTDFGEFDQDTGIWKPIIYTGSYGTNGFYLDYENSGSLGADQSGNGNNFTVNNLTSIDQVTDTPTNNFCTTNPLDQNGGMVFSDGNLSNASTSASWRSTRGTFGITQGKWFFEVKAVNTGGALLDMMVGIADFSLAIPSEFSSSNPALTYTAGSGNKQLNGVNSAYGSAYNVNDIIGVAFDADALTVTFYKNGVSQGTITTGWSSGLTWSPAISLYGRYGNTQASFDFGNPPFTISSGNSDANGYGNFEYSVPSGYYALNNKNLAQYG